MHDLAKMEAEAFQCKADGDVAGAVALWERIVTTQPDWEHGRAYYNLGACYQDLGRYPAAESCYRHALRFEPMNDIFLGGLASFLYLHGMPQDAFEAHIDLLRSYKGDISSDDEASIKLALHALGTKLGWSSEKTAVTIESRMG